VIGNGRKSIGYSPEAVRGREISRRNNTFGDKDTGLSSLLGRPILSRGMKYQTRIIGERYGLGWLHITFEEERHREVLQDDEGEDETILQQPTIDSSI
jgi:hypothetical protein